MIIVITLRFLCSFLLWRITIWSLELLVKSRHVSNCRGRSASIKSFEQWRAC